MVRAISRFLIEHMFYGERKLEIKDIVRNYGERTLFAKARAHVSLLLSIHGTAGLVHPERHMECVSAR